jgi:hypothetical protein
MCAGNVAIPLPSSEFPVKYLGIPLSVTRLPQSALHPLIDKVADRLPVWKGRLMHRSGRLALIKSTLMAIPIYTSISVGLPSWMRQAMEKIMKAFLWTVTDTIPQGKCLVA